MGNAARRTGELPDQASGLTESEKKLIKSTWSTFCSNNREYGVLLFLSLFVKHPEYLPMFRNFRAKHVAALKDDPAFRAHGCAVGYHLTSMVDNISDPATFEVLVRRNATEHLRRKGVKPHHFQVMGECVIDVLEAKEDRLMTPAAVDAWKKFLSYMVAIIKDVFDKAAAERAQKHAESSFDHDSAMGVDEAALTASLRTTDSESEGPSHRRGTRKSQPESASRATSPHGNVAGSRGLPEDSTATQSGKSSSRKGRSRDVPASAGSQGGGAGGAKEDTKTRKEQSTFPSPRDKTVPPPRADKSGATEKPKLDKNLPDKGSTTKGAAEDKGALSPKDKEPV